MANKVVQSVREAEDPEKVQYKAFVDDRMINMTKSIHDTIPKNILTLFKSGQGKRSSKTKVKISSIKSDLELFFENVLFWSGQRKEDGCIFEHENHVWPPSLAENNLMHHGNKADLLKCLEPMTQHPNSSPEVDVKILLLFTHWRQRI